MRGLRRDGERGGWRVERRWTVGGEAFRRARRFPAKRAAEAYARELDAEIQAAKALVDRLGLLPVVEEPEAAAPRLTLSAFAGEFSAWLLASEASPSTIAGYESHLRSTILPTLGTLQLDQVTPAVVDQLRLGLQEQGRSPKGPLIPLSSMLSLAVDRGLLERNPCHMGRRRRRTAALSKRTDRGPARPLSSAQRQAVLEAWPANRPRERIAYILAAWCGLRLGEVRGLRRQDCHLDERWLHVRCNVVRAAKGFAVRPPKSGRERTVAITEWVAQELRPWALCDRPYILADDRGGPLRGDGGRSALTRAYRKALAAAGVVPPIRFHDLRATAASCWLADGVPRVVVKTLLGHATDEGLGEDVLGKHYERLSLGDLQRWVT